MKKTIAAVLAVALMSVVLVGCGEDDDCYEDEASGTGVELVAAVDGKSGGSSGGKSGTGRNPNNGKPNKGGKPGSSNAGVGLADDDCDDD